MGKKLIEDKPGLGDQDKRSYRSGVLSARKLIRASELLRGGTALTLADVASRLHLPVEFLAKHLYRNGEFRVAPGRNAGLLRARQKLALMPQLVQAGASGAVIQAKLNITPEQYRRFLKKLNDLKAGKGRPRLSASPKKI